MGLVVDWQPLFTHGINGDVLKRSSHSLAVVDRTAFIFAGELIPRIPRDADMIAVDLTNGLTQIISSPSSTSSACPAPRVGSALVSHNGSLYLWGGRGGKAMSTFDDDEDLWRFDISTKSWNMLKTTGERPAQRSFHAMSILGDDLYLHAGCPISGRLPTLHSLSLNTLVWRKLEDAPGPGRGGTVICALNSSPPSSSSAAPLLVRFGGFAGFELDGFTVYDVASGSWKSCDVGIEGEEGTPPAARSVHALIPVDGSITYGDDKRVVAVMIHGEREGAPAELGHDGAGFFHSDTWALLSTSAPTPAFSWLRLTHSKSTSSSPRARGWFASSSIGGNKILIQGGLDENNERLEDGWILEVKEE